MIILAINTFKVFVIFWLEQIITKYTTTSYLLYFSKNFGLLLREICFKIVDISVGHTPDSDDAFMFYAMFTEKVKSDDFTVTHVIEDIENLNKKAKNPELDVTAVSVHACAYIPNYVMLRSGGSFWN